MSDFPYADRFDVNRVLPERGRDRDAVLAEMRAMAAAEDPTWETGKVSGTMYCGDHQHYRFLDQAFGLFAHVNALQRDICPSATKFEGEVIAMALDLMHAEALTDTEPAGMVTTGGTGSILHALLAYREHAAKHRGITTPNFIKPETGHPAFDKGCHLFGIELRTAPIDPKTTRVDLDWVAEHIDANTIAMMGSAPNYGYGTIDAIPELGRLAAERGVGLHVDGCLGGFVLPFAEELGYGDAVPRFDFRVPGVTSISTDNHKYGYALKGASTLLFADRAYRNAQYFFLSDWTGGKYMSPGIEGSRSGGLIAAAWASMVQLGREGYRRYAKAIFDTAFAMQDAVRSHPELTIIGDPTFCFSFRSDVFDIYHVADAMKLKGWRFNGQQYPNAIHMAVTRPQTRPGVLEAFTADLDDAVDYAKKKAAAGETPIGAAIYGGVPGGLTVEATQFIEAMMERMLDAQQSLPARS